MTLRDGTRSQAVSVQSFPRAWTGVPGLSQLGISPAFEGAVRRAAEDCAVVHAHGLWLMPNVYGGAAAALARKPLIVSPRGMLAAEALEFSPWKKRTFWALLQKRAYASAAAWHATSSAEAEDIRRFGITAPIIVIPNGVDMPATQADHSPAKSLRTILFLSRLHPKKNLPSLIDAWSRVAPKRQDWQLVIAGPDEGGHRAVLEARASAANTPRICFLDPVYGDEKDVLLAGADLFVLPTQNENFGIAVAESLAAGVPAIVTRGAPWSGLERFACGWWIEHGYAPLTEALLAATMISPAERRSMGQRGKAWMERDFGWDAIAMKMVDVYEWLRGRGPSPECLDTRK